MRSIYFFVISVILEYFQRIIQQLLLSKSANWLHKMPIILDITFCLKQSWSVHTIHDGQNQWPTSPFSMLPASTSFLTPLYTTCHCSISLSLFTKVGKQTYLVYFWLARLVIPNPLPKSQNLCKVMNEQG